MALPGLEPLTKEKQKHNQITDHLVWNGKMVYSPLNFIHIENTTENYFNQHPAYFAKFVFSSLAEYYLCLPLPFRTHCSLDSSPQSS